MWHFFCAIGWRRVLQFIDRSKSMSQEEFWTEGVPHLFWMHHQTSPPLRYFSLEQDVEISQIQTARMYGSSRLLQSFVRGWRRGPNQYVSTHETVQSWRTWQDETVDVIWGLVDVKAQTSFWIPWYYASEKMSRLRHKLWRWSREDMVRVENWHMYYANSRSPWQPEIDKDIASYNAVFIYTESCATTGDA